MIKHCETKIVPYTANQMFKLVADIDSYPDFIPWCNAVRINSRTEGTTLNSEILDADMLVSFKVFRETFASKVTLDQLSNKIDVEYINGPFKFLSNNWTFSSNGNDCRITFKVAFEFKSKIMQRLIGLVFTEAMKRIVAAFEKEANSRYKTKS
jgi:coenzyme Q-binding protein COQ10